MIGGLSPIHWLIILFLIAVQVIPIGIVLKRTGYSPLLAILWIIPLVGWIGLWLFAYARWPNVRTPADEAKAF